MEQRTMQTVIRNQLGNKFNLAEQVRKKYFPRNKYEAYSSSNLKGRTLYTLKVNLTKSELREFEEILFHYEMKGGAN